MQHARPVGPTGQNAEAPFGPEMVQGSLPHRPADRPLWARLSQRAAVAVPPDVQPFGIEMVFGSRPDTGRPFTAPRSPMPLAQTTHVEAPLGPEMTQGDQPTRHREFLPLRRGHTWWPPDVDAFDVAMTQGSHPDSPHLFVAPRLPVTPTSHTHIPPGITIDMLRGWVPDRHREFLPLRVGLRVESLVHIEAPFSVEMVYGHAIPARYREVLPLRLGWVSSQLTHVAAGFSVEMVQGHQPLRFREGLPLRIDWQVAQVTHVTAGISPEMLAGWYPDRKAYEDLRPRLGWLAQVSEQIAFTVEHWRGWQPEQPRLFTAPRLGIPPAQHTHVAAPFGIEMVRGEHVDRPREFIAPRFAYAIIAPDVPAFSIEMIRGWRPDRPHLFLAPRLPVPPSQLTHVAPPFSPEMVTGDVPHRHRERLAPRTLHIAIAPDVFDFSIEMVRGSRPDRPVLFVAPQLPVAPSQVTHVAAPLTQSMITGSKGERFRERLGPKTFGANPPDVIAFGIETVIGSRPDRPRLFLAPRFLIPPSQLTHVEASFTPSMTQGSRPDRGREFLPVRLAWRIAQTTHDDAAFSPDMVAGWQPEGNRAFLPLGTGVRIESLVHVENAFGPEMVQGHDPDRPRVFLHPARVWFLVHVKDLSDIISAADPKTLELRFGALAVPGVTGGLFLVSTIDDGDLEN